MMNRVILKAEDLDGYLQERDREYLARMDQHYRKVMESFKFLSSAIPEERRMAEDGLIVL